MAWRLAADAALVTHFGFIVFMVAGGLVGRRRSSLLVLHLLTLGYGVTITTLGFTCPLTPLEKALRRSAGEAGYDGSFIEHYLLDVIYPGGIDATLRLVMVLGLVAVVTVSYAPAMRRGPVARRDSGTEAPLLS